jgi:hypothetical protein
MEKLEFNDVLDNYLTTGNMLTDDYEALDEEQKMIIQTIKRAFKRLTNKQ